jgi:hypothetical protein
VRGPSPRRRALNGAIGSAVGAALGALACPTCRGEGGEDRANRNIAIGAAAGAAALLIPAYQPIYDGPRRK